MAQKWRPLAVYELGRLREMVVGSSKQDVCQKSKITSGKFKISRFFFNWLMNENFLVLIFIILKLEIN